MSERRMSQDASEDQASLSETLPSLFQLVSYLMLCVAKMPFIPPMSIPRSVSGLTGKDRPAFRSTPTATSAKLPREDRGGSVKERLTSNLKQLGKKSTTAALGPERHPERRDRPLPSPRPASFPVSASGASQRGVKSDQAKAGFTLTLAPEAVLLLRRRNNERRQHPAPRNTGSGTSISGGVSDSRRRRENGSKRALPAGATQRHGAVKSSGDGELGDISSIVKISLLNERHKYDDVEYEDEEDDGVDERVVLKCTEWLRGLENSPVMVGGGLQAV